MLSIAGFTNPSLVIFIDTVDAKLQNVFRDKTFAADSHFGLTSAGILQHLGHLIRYLSISSAVFSLRRKQTAHDRTAPFGKASFFIFRNAFIDKATVFGFSGVRVLIVYGLL